MVPTSEDIWQALDNGAVWGPLIGRASLAQTARAFHWPLEFPDVFDSGGFDAVVGNPPWERIKLQEQEFFAARSPAIANAANKAARGKMIRALAAAPEGSAEAALYQAFQIAKRSAEASSEFARTPDVEEFTGRDRVVTLRPVGGRFPLTGRGDVNTYALFAELFSRLTSKTGRAGVIVPTGIATDATTAPFFAHLVAKRRLARLVDFENRAGLFAAVDSRMKFSLLTLGHDEGTARFAFFLTDPAQLAEPERNFTLTPGAIARLNPNTKTAPVFRSRKDAELTAQIYEAAPVLIEERKKGEEGNPWKLTVHTRLWHMAEDAFWFRTASHLSELGFTREGRNWTRLKPAFVPSDNSVNIDEQETHFSPMIEAKMVTYYDHRAATYGERGNDRGYRVLPETTLEQHQDPHFEAEPYYWVPTGDLNSRLDPFTGRGWLLGWKDVAAATNERTATFAIVPRAAVGHTMPLMFPGTSPKQTAALYGNLCSLTLDYAARQSVSGLHLTLGYLKQLPILPPTFYTPERLDFLTPRVLELTYTSYALAPFARDLGFDGPPFAWDEPRRAQLRADLDAVFARAYRLNREDLRYILDPAEVMGAAYPSETFRVLKEKEQRLYGEYRTQRLVLSAWDRMEADGTFAGMGM